MEHGEGEADDVAPPRGETLGPVHLLGHIGGNCIVEVLLGRGELEGHGVGTALWEQGTSVEAKKLLLDHPAHQVGGVDLSRGRASPAFEAVLVQEGQEELEVLVLTSVRGGGEQQQVAGGGRE